MWLLFNLSSELYFQINRKAQRSSNLLSIVKYKHVKWWSSTHAVLLFIAGKGAAAPAVLLLVSPSSKQESINWQMGNLGVDLSWIYLRVAKFVIGECRVPQTCEGRGWERGPCERLGHVARRAKKALLRVIQALCYGSVKVQYATR